MSVYQGHQSNGSGLQNHSIGGIYPYIIGYKPFTKEYYLMFSSGDILKHYSNYSEAYSIAENLLKLYNTSYKNQYKLSEFNSFVLNTINL